MGIFLFTGFVGLGMHRTGFFLFSGFELCLGNWRVGYVRSFNCEVADCIDAVTFTECLGGVEMGKVDVVNSRPKQPGLDGPSGC
jgi:hypothetical protein